MCGCGWVGEGGRAVWMWVGGGLVSQTGRESGWGVREREGGGGLVREREGEFMGVREREGGGWGLIERGGSGWGSVR